MNSAELFSDADDQILGTTMEDYESQLEMSTRIIDIRPHHLFRYPSEWDPRKKGNTKGGYLEGCINLPDRNGRNVRILLKTHPDDDLILQNDVRFNMYDQFHPAVIHTVRKEKGNRRNCEKEPVPHVQHWIQEFKIIGEDVFIVNRTSRLDDVREDKHKNKLNIPKEDKMFQMQDPNKLPIGKLWNQINLVILIPKTDARANEHDLKLGKMIESRISDPEARKSLSQKFSGKNTANIKKMKLKIEIFDLNTNELLSVGLSNAISDTNSKKHGDLDIHEVTPLKSCERGGRKIVMISEFSLDKSVEPRFLLYDCEGVCLDGYEDTMLRQPDNVSMFKDSSISFLTPAQERRNIETIIRNNWKIKLVFQRQQDDGVTTVSHKRIDFDYVPHDFYNSLISCCVFCDFSPDISAGETPALAALRKRAAPNRKKRQMSGEESDRSKSIRSSTDSTESLSPTSADVDSPGPVLVNNTSQDSIDSGCFTEIQSAMKTSHSLVFHQNNTQIGNMSPSSAYPTLNDLFPETDDESELPMKWCHNNIDRSLDTPPPIESDKMQQSLALHSYNKHETVAGPEMERILKDITIVKDGIRKDTTEQTLSEHNESPLTRNTNITKNIVNTICKAMFGKNQMKREDVDTDFIFKQFGLFIPILLIVLHNFPACNSLFWSSLGIILTSLVLTVIWKVSYNLVISYVFPANDV